ncbi:NACHT and WD repeat domain-containing protein [Actinomadura fulvescens]|uniref:Uncharacterized protein n=1 Tax=Actinomadura fulvescens TaxID=46160 RepID=A0ABN3PG63_9ACTN
MSDDVVRRPRRSLLPAAVAAGGTVLATVVGALVNLITSGWSTSVFAALIVLVAVSSLLPFAGTRAEEWAERRLRSRERRDARALRLAELRGHFQTSSRGLTRSGLRRGWYFTGRRRVLAELVAWIAGSDDPRARLVTGEPGSGKSAVLGRVATFGYAGLRNEVPAAELARADPATLAPPGSVRAAVFARGLSARQAATLIAAELGVVAELPGDLLDRLSERPLEGRGIVIVDAVDEAADPAELIRELLEPLAATAHRTGVRLLAGMRPGWNRRLVRQFGPHAVEIDLDDEEHARPEDVADYVFRLLTEDEHARAPYRERPETARAVAGAVAARAGTSFLVAQLTGLALAAAPDVADVGEQFPDSVGSAMEHYLERLGTAADRTRIRDLLMPLALAEGKGLADRRVWARLATELGARTYTDQDITWLLRDSPAPDVLHRGTVDGRYTYRLFHLALGEYLRGIAEAERPAADIQRRFAEILVDVAAGDWTGADSYTRTYLATHAAAGGVLDPLHEDAEFLVAASPDRLLQALPAASSARGRELSFVVQRAGFGLLRSAADRRASYLELAARKCGETALADAIRACSPGRPWSVPWAHWRRITCGRILGHVPGYVRELEVADVPGGTIVVAAGDTEVRSWWLADGGQYGPAISDIRARIRNLGVLTGPTGVEAVTWHLDETRQRWDLRTGRPIGDPSRFEGIDGAWEIRLGERELTVIRRGDALRVLDGFSEDQAVSELMIAEMDAVGTVKVVDGRLLALVVFGDGRVRIWDLLARRPVGEVLDPLAERDPVDREIWSADLARFGDDLVAFISHPIRPPDFADTHAWDTARNRPVTEPIRGLAIGALDITVIELDGVRLVCRAGADGRIVCRQWPDGDVGGGPVVAHDGGVDWLTGTESGPDGSPLLLSGGRDGAVRCWPMDMLRSAPEDESEEVTEAVASIRSIGRSLVVGLVGRPGDLVTWDVATGDVVARWRTDEPVDLRLATVGTNSEPLVAAVMDSGTITLWDPLTGAARAEFADAVPAGASETCTAWIDGRPMILIVYPDGLIHLWDVQDGAAPRPPFECHPSLFGTAFKEIDGVPHVVTATFSGNQPPRLWRLPSCESAEVNFEPCAHDHAGHEHARLAVGDLGDRPVAVRSGYRSHIDVWDLRDGRLLRSGQLDDGHLMALGPTVLGRLRGRQVAVTSGYAGAVTIWDLDGVHEVIDTGNRIHSLVIDQERRIVAGGLMGLIAIDVE